MSKMWATGILSLWLVGAGCGKGEPATGPTPTKETAAPSGGPAKPAPTLIGAYDTLREALASDDLKAGAAAAAKLADVAAAKYPSIADQAKGAASAADLDAMRRQFGEVSKAMIEAAVKEPALAEGLVTYRCPMAEGYKKWVQLGPPMRNPYMGQKMLECGSKVDLTP